VLENFPKPTQTQKNYYSEEEEPAETEEQKIIRQLKRFGISSFSHTFDKFVVTPPTKNAYDTLKAVINGSSMKKFILLYGATGCGKTHLIEAMIIEWAKNGVFSHYQTFSDIARYLKSGLKFPELYERRFTAICNSVKLIIDDFGMGTTESRFEVSDLEDIIDIRYRRRYYPGSQEVTILASNKDIKDLPDRVVSRFYDSEFGKVLYMGDRDYRRRKL